MGNRGCDFLSYQYCKFGKVLDRGSIRGIAVPAPGKEVLCNSPLYGGICIKSERENIRIDQRLRSGHGGPSDRKRDAPRDDEKFTGGTPVTLNTSQGIIENVMSRSGRQVYQFKIALKGITPRIWRKIEVPAASTFWDLSIAIQDTLDWRGYHLHEFTIKDPRTGATETIGMPDNEFPDRVRKSWTTKISRYFTMDNRKAVYVYDFGDYWEHIVTLEKILPADPRVTYPRCIGGRGAAPPEDVGGVTGFEEFKEIMQDPDHEEHDEMVEWYGGEWEPKDFSCTEVFFSDPKELLELMLDQSYPG